MGYILLMLLPFTLFIFVNPFPNNHLKKEKKKKRENRCHSFFYYSLSQSVLMITLASAEVDKIRSLRLLIIPLAQGTAFRVSLVTTALASRAILCVTQQPVTSRPVASEYMSAYYTKELSLRNV